MKLFETVYDGKSFGYRVDQNGVVSITKKAGKVSVVIDNPEIGTYTSHFDLAQLPVYTIG